MFQNRRQFLIIGAVAGGSILMPDVLHLLSADQKASSSVQKSPWSGFAIGHGRKESGRDKFYASPRVDESGRVLIADFAGTQVREYKTKFVCHQIIQNPKRLTQFFGIQKWGDNAVAIDMESNQTKPLELPVGHYFFGHGFCTTDGQHVFISAMDTKTNEGQLLIYETKSLKLVNKYRTYGVNPHDTQTSLDGKNILVMHGGNLRSFLKDKSKATNKNSCLTRLSIESGAFVSHAELDRSNQAYGHFLNLDDQDVLCMGLRLEKTDERALPPALALLSGLTVNDFVSSSILKDFTGEALSARMIKDSIVLITLPDSDKVVLLDVKKRAVLKTYDLRKPRSVARMPSGDFLISQSTESELFVVYKNEIQAMLDLKGYFQSLKNSNRSQWSANGAHMTEIVWPEV